MTGIAGGLEGKVVLVTGAASGIGAAAVARLRAAGARVCGTDIRAAPVSAADLSLTHDVASPAAWQSVHAAVLDEFGRLDGLVNCAGIFVEGMIADISLATWDRLVAINQTAILLSLQACVDSLAQDGGGSVVNLSSYAGLQGRGTSVAYQATKWAVRGITRFAAREFASRQVRVNAIAPGFIDTPMVQAAPPAMRESINQRTPLGRIGTASEVAEAIRYLISDDSSYVTGIDLVIDGGIVA